MLASIKKNALKDLEKVLDSRWLTSGKVTTNLETKINKFIKSNYVSMVSNCTFTFSFNLQRN